MSTETITAPPTAPAETLEVVSQANVSLEVAQTLQSAYAGLFQAARSVLEKSRTINVTSVDQKLEMKVAREYRLELKRIRVEADKTRKALKEDVLRRGKAIDGFFNILVDLTGSEETRLAEAEAFAERKEAERIEARTVERRAKLDTYGFDHRFTDLKAMPDADFNSLLVQVQIQHDAKVEAARKAEVERLAREKAEAEEKARREVEEKRIREENERLKAEMAKKEAEARAQRERELAERAAAEEKARAEAAAKEAEAQKERDRMAAIAAEKEEAARQERLRVEEAARVERERLKAIAAEEKAAADALRAELEAKQAEEKAAAEAAAEEERQAALAPEREKLGTFAASLLALDVPELASENGRIVAAAIKTRVANLAKFINAEAKRL